MRTIVFAVALGLSAIAAFATGPLGSAEERVAYLAFSGLQANVKVGDWCTGGPAARSTASRLRLTVAQDCDDSTDRWRHVATVERRSACVFAVTYETSHPLEQEYFEAELDFSQVDWGLLGWTAGYISGDDLIARRQTYTRRGPPTQPTLDLRAVIERPHSIAVAGDDAGFLEAQFRAVLGAFRAECPGRG